MKSISTSYTVWKDTLTEKTKMGAGNQAEEKDCLTHSWFTEESLIKLNMAYS